MLKSGVIEGFSNGTNASVHHVARANQIGTSLRLHHRLTTAQLNGLVIEHHPVLADDAVMAITGIGVKGHIGHDRHIGQISFELTNGCWDQAVFVKTLSAILRLETLRHLGEQHHTADAEIPGPLHLAAELIQAPSKGTRHGSNRLDLRTLMHE